ncbi:hypothetical protein MRX96_021301 [Rhipicephalus microplus]
MTETLKKTDDDHDSGTESDDESAEIEELQKYMEQSIQLEDSSGGHSASRLCQHASFRQPESRQQNKSADRRRLLLPQQHHHSELLSSPAVVLVTAHHVVGTNVAPNSSPVLLDSALPSDSDPNLEQHSSEEGARGYQQPRWFGREAQMVTGQPAPGGPEVSVVLASLRRSRSDGGGDTSSDEEECDAASGATLADGVSSRATANGRSSSSTAVVPPTPVEFRASPPLHVHRPYNGSPPPKVFHAAPGVVGGSSPSATSSSSGPTTLTLSAHIPAFEVCAVSPRKRHRQDGGGHGVRSLLARRRRTRPAALPGLREDAADQGEAVVKAFGARNDVCASYQSSITESLG